MLTTAKLAKVFFGLSVMTGVVASGFSLMSSPAKADDDIKPVLIVGTEAGYAPYESLNDKGEMVGFDIDLLNHLCKEVGVTCQLKNMSFDSLIPSIKYRKIDMAIAAMSATPQRLKIVAFTNSYTPANSMSYLVLKNSNFTDPSKLDTVAYQNGTLIGKYLMKATSYDLKGYNTYDMALLDLKSGRVNALAADTAVVKNFVNLGDFKILGKPVYNDELSAGMGIAMNLKDKALLEKFNAAIAKAKADGYLDKLYAKYDIH